ncbi:alpha-lytic protease prodomain-containing protein [Streptomyces sp. NPDC059757]|uniref:alpha-lytic protease prodomain-containing protein n=1 Tax=Streptomyces sp. NPDC059757 TaxID=3346935 RepID=UPI0036575170
MGLGSQDVPQLPYWLCRTGGVYYKEGHLSVAVTDQAAAQCVRDAGGTPGLVTRSAAELASVHHKLDQLENIPNTARGVEAKTNQVSVEIFDGPPPVGPGSRRWRRLTQVRSASCTLCDGLWRPRSEPADLKSDAFRTRGHGRSCGQKATGAASCRGLLQQDRIGECRCGWAGGGQGWAPEEGRCSGPTQGRCRI